VTFWATWAQPSKELLSRLDKIAEKHEGKAEVLAMSVFEKQLDENERFKNIAQTLEGLDLNCHVSADTSSGLMGRTWLWAADETTPPIIFLIEKDNKIGWIGQPSEDLEGIVSKAVNGTLDRKAMQQARSDQRASRVKEDEALKQMNDLWREKKYDQALAALDDFISQKPAYKKGLIQFRYNLLLEADENAAYRYAEDLSKSDYKNDANSLAGMALSICQTPNLKKPDYSLAEKMAKRACDLNDPNKPRHLLSLAEVYLKTKNYDKALKSIEEAKDLATAQKNSPERSALLEEIESRLQRVQEAKAKSQEAKTSVQ
jgi:tetratricopeptide (TPR) repeat protein